MFPLEAEKDRIEFLERELKFLDIFLNLQSSKAKCDTLDVTPKAQALLHDTRVALSSLNLTSPNFYPSIYQMEDDIRLIKSEITVNYSFPEISRPLSASKNGVAISEIVPEFIGTVVCILSDLLNICDGRSILFVPGPKEQIVEVLEELKSLRAFVCFVAKRCGKEPQSCHHDFFTHIFVVAGHAAMLVWLSLPGTNNGTQDLASSEMNALLSDHLRMRIKPIEPSIRKIYVDVLQALKSTSQSGWRPDIQNENTTNSEAGFLETVLHNLAELPTIGNATVALKDEIANLQEMLNLLRADLPCTPMQHLESHFEDLHIMIIDAGILVYSLYDVASANVNQALLDFPGNIQHFNTLIYPIVQKVFQSNLPPIQGIGYVDFLLSNLNEFQGRYSKSLVSIKNQLQIIQKELKSVQPFLKDVAKERHKHHKIQHLAQLVIGTAYEVEYIADSFISKEVPEWCLERWLVDIIEEIKLNSAKINIQLKKTPAVDIDTAAAHTSSESMSPKNEEIVGFDHIVPELRKKLTKGSQQLDVISIVGMGGQGKTTLANKLFNDDSVKSRFDIRAQCCVSQEYSCRSILLAILCDLSCDDPATSELSTEDLRDKLQKICKVRRYLILIDDIWEASVWEDLQPCFADVNNGSRIILTTRQVEVANSARISCEPFHLPMFKEDESWKLLKQKVFGKEGCSPDLEKVGLEIAKKCAGLPLSIVLVAGILAKEKNERYWRQVAKNLGSHIQSDAKAIIEHSYKHLPHHLKPCFLYFGVISEDKTINVSDLTCLWIAEGFIKIDKEKSLEDVASDYLENLIGRNLVKIAKRSIDGKVKACQIHDLLLDFCKETAEQEKLLLCIDRYQSANPPPGIYSHRQLAQRRLSIYANKNGLAKWISPCSLVDSVLCRDHIIENLSPTSRIFQKFKFLKVLDLKFIIVDSFPTELFYLRYFAVRTAKKSITSCISNLWNLGTLIVKGEGTDLSLPFTLWKMSKLRTLHICDNAYFTINGAKESLENSNLDNLETLSCPCFSCAEDAEFVLGKTPNIRNLRCSIKYPEGNFWVLQLEFLAQLKTLKVHFDVPSAVADAYIFPSSLNKLTLSTIFWGTGLEIAMLPNLQVLKLVNVEFDKGEWTVNDNEFPKLKVLKVVNSDNFKEWNVLDDAFPCLEHLTLHKCQYLKEIPSWFAEIASLKFVRVRSCNEALVASVKEIRTMQVEDYQRSEFQIFVD